MTGRQQSTRDMECRFPMTMTIRCYECGKVFDAVLTDSNPHTCPCPACGRVEVVDLRFPFDLRIRCHKCGTLFDVVVTSKDADEYFCSACGNREVLGLTECIYLKPQKQPLRVATCAHCGVKFFFQNPEASRQIIRLRTHKQPPDAANHSKILPYDCLRCHQPQFIEVIYES